MFELRRFGRWTGSLFLKVLLLLTATSAALAMTIGSPDNVKTTLQESGIYEGITQTALDEAQKAAKEEGGDNLPIDDPKVQEAINKAFSPAFLQDSTENFINGIYTWLEGETETPSFSIDITRAKQTFVTEVGNYLEDRYRSLPPCTQQQLINLQANNVNNVDLFNVPCQIPGYDVSAQRQQYEAELLSSETFLKDNVITADNLKNEQGQPVFEQLNQVPRAYVWFQRSPWLLGGLALLIILSLVFLSESRRKGLSSVSWSLAGIGLSVLIGAIISLWAIGKFIGGDSSKLTANGGLFGLSAGSPLETSSINVLQSVLRDFATVLLWFGAVYLVVGVGTLIWLKISSKSKEPDEPFEHHEPKPDAHHKDEDKKDVEPIKQPNSKGEK